MQQNKLYVGNFPYSIDEDQLRELFSPYGEIDELALIMDRETGRSKGFAFITFAKQQAAETNTGIAAGATKAPTSRDEPGVAGTAPPFPRGNRFAWELAPPPKSLVKSLPRCPPSPSQAADRLVHICAFSPQK